MLKLFRKIRQKLVKKGKVKSYLLYAIGEIMLIVIGILIALQVTNWNESKKDKKIEHTYLEAMKVEVEENQKKLERVIKKNDKGIENAEKLVELLNQPPSDVLNVEISKLFNEIFKYKIKNNPNTGVLEDIINSGNLNKISNFQLRNIIASWEVYYSQVTIQEASIQDIRDTIITLLKRSNHFEGIKHPDTDKIVGLRLKTFLNENKSNTANYAEFKNNLLFLIVTSAALSNNYYGSFEKRLKTTLELINEELKK